MPSRTNFQEQRLAPPNARRFVDDKTIREYYGLPEDYDVSNICHNLPIDVFGQLLTDDYMRDRMLRCTGCFKSKRVFASCNQRNCEVCSRKRSFVLVSKYRGEFERAMKEGHRLSWGLLTGFYLTVTENLRRDLTRFEDLGKFFLEKYYPAGALLALETTDKSETPAYLPRLPVFVDWIDRDYTGVVEACPLISGSGKRQLFVHLHFLALGGRVDLEEVQKKWGEALYQAGFISRIEAVKYHGGRMVSAHEIRNNQDLNGRLFYVLGYVGKHTHLTGRECAMLKGAKYIRTYGRVYGKNMMASTSRSVCFDCGAELEIVSVWSAGGGAQCKDDLKIKRIVTLEEPVGPP